MSKRYFQLTKTGEMATLNIYGNIGESWGEGVTVKSLSQQLTAMHDVTAIDVYINSMGGEVAEGLAIYNALKRHKAKVRTYCDGFAASIASVIFMAGDERIMNDSSLLMIHNAWILTAGNAQELRKQADDLEKITQASIIAYKAHSSLSEDEIKALMDNESWILPEEALAYGFATSIEKTDSKNASQNARKRLFELVKMHADPHQAEDEDEEEQPADESPETDQPGTEDDEPGDEPPAEPETPSDDEPADDEEASKEDEDKNPEEAAQRWSGFFNALLRM